MKNDPEKQDLEDAHRVETSSSLETLVIEAIPSLGSHNNITAPSTKSLHTVIPSDDAPAPLTLFQRLQRSQRNSIFQLTLVALLSFLGPGMWNALNGIGGAGLVSAGPANEANIALYTTFAIGGFFGGIVVNRLGFRLSFVLGELGYALYSGSTLAYKHIGSKVFIVAAGTQLGFSAGWFWTAQTATITSYPTDGERGKAVAVWGLIYNSGACIGSLVSLDVTRSDGTSVEIPRSPTWKEATLDLWKCLHREPHLVFIFPMYFASNFFYPYQFNTFNLKHFTIRTRAFNNIIYWLAEIAGNLITGSLLDVKHACFSVRNRAQMCLVILLLSTCGVCTCAFLWQQGAAPITAVSGKIDYTDHVYYTTGAALYAGFGLLAASYTGSLIWLLKPICPNDENRIHLGGIFKGIQSAGGAVAFHINTIGIAPTTELAINWGLLAGGILIAAPMVFKKARSKEEFSNARSVS
ncbi:uncharacterized protein LY89DRAFT_633630 [Mollisia scopiformis]|uniref:MFS general substrate transporter n=1 Tax=Mollisia scopiformis TaxID=149040 RepID=A0A194XUU1_MOLSC|nr:uncharacterized protein LY89DRAFT_633630 [Mollisia scopiformis]KUJ23906.1 hypothetical protein LY89DRAFT_633630 [Mollisia scopiformis]